MTIKFIQSLPGSSLWKAFGILVAQRCPSLISPLAQPNILPEQSQVLLMDACVMDTCGAVRWDVGLGQPSNLFRIWNQKFFASFFLHSDQSTHSSEACPSFYCHTLACNPVDTFCCNRDKSLGMKMHARFQLCVGRTSNGNQSPNPFLAWRRLCHIHKGLKPCPASTALASRRRSFHSKRKFLQDNRSCSKGHCSGSGIWGC